MNALAACRARLRSTALHRRIGWVRRVHGLAIESDGPQAQLGELCRIVTADAEPGGGLLAEVVGLREGQLTLLAYGSVQGVAAGAEVVALGHRSQVAVGPELVGRVIDAFGVPLDGLPAPRARELRPLHAPAPNPMERPRIDTVLETGVRVIDALFTIGRGQRVGIFAGSGVGKSTLLGMIARHVQADVNVIALVGERGREVRDFVEQQLGAEGLRRSVVVVASADQPALARVRAAHAAVAIASWFRESGAHVLLTLDSMTRLAMARREIGLAAGEPPTARGYTPSVFAELPQLCERCGTSPSGGSVTALFTVLVEGDDLNEPISDCLRALLDGHIVLSRDLAQQAHFPAIDPLKSASRLLPVVATPSEQELAASTMRRLALLERNRPMVEIGAYAKGGNPALDQALALDAGLQDWLRQRAGGVSRQAALERLAEVLSPGRTG